MSDYTEPRRADTEPRTSRGKHDLVFHFGHEELVIRKRYEALSIANDILIGLWFLVGSFMFFSETLQFAGTVLFVIGSLEMLLRPVIRLARHVHLQRVSDRPPSEATLDF